MARDDDEPNQGWIDPDAAVAYALATNDPNDVYLREGAVPPLYTTALVQPSFAQAEGKTAGAVILGARSSVHAEHDVRFSVPLRPGDALRWELSMHALRQTSAGVLMTRRALVTDLEGRGVAEHLWSSMYLGGTIDAEVGPALDDHAFPPEARARPMGTSTVAVDVDQSYRYAGASGDRNPHSIDDEAARREGFPRKLLQGLCTLAMCSGVVVARGADGDPDRLRRLVGRFSAPVFVRQDLTVELYDAGRSPDGGQVLAFEATAGGVTVIKHGRAELLPA